jgi:hypothetical protein
LREFEELYLLVMTIIGKASEGSVESLKAAEIADAALAKYRAFTEPSQIFSEEEKAYRLRHLEALLEELAADRQQGEDVRGVAHFGFDSVEEARRSINDFLSTLPLPYPDFIKFECAIHPDGTVDVALKRGGHAEVREGGTAGLPLEALRREVRR